MEGQKQVRTGTGPEEIILEGNVILDESGLGATSPSLFTVSIGPRAPGHSISVGCRFGRVKCRCMSIGLGGDIFEKDVVGVRRAGTGAQQLRKARYSERLKEGQ